MRSVASFSLAAALLGSVSAAPYNPFPLSDGFPSPNAQQLASIQQAAGGSLPNSGLPTSLTASATTTFQLIALNEAFEVAFFSSLLQNITSGATGFDLSGYNKTLVTDTITAILAQEQLHFLGANGILQSAGATPIQTCQYQFPTTTFQSAIALANTFTDLVLSTLPLAQVGFATDGGQETGLVQLVSSIIGQEGEQNGWFRSLQNKIAAAAPFLTTGHPTFAFTALQNFIVPGSCPNINIISSQIPTYQPLNIVSGAAQGVNSTVTFSIPSANAVSASADSVIFLSGQNKPYVASISNVQSSNGATTFQAILPAGAGLISNGLTIAAVVNCVGVNFSKIGDALSYIKFGPGLIEL